MILFNLSFYGPLLNVSHNSSLYYKVQRMFNLASSRHQKLFYCSSLDDSNLGSQLDLKSYTKTSSSKIMKRNFWQKLINKYWQETIFISSSNSLIDNYTNKLKSTGLSVYTNNDYKNFLLQFSKDLLDRKIYFTLNSLNSKKVSELRSENNFYVKYKWLKFQNPNILLKQYNFSELKPYEHTRSFDSSLPLFILINNDKQIILAESSDELSNTTVLLKFYNKLTARGLHNKNLYTGLFFVNPEDAIEYKNYITEKYKKSTRNLKIQVVTTTLSFYKKMLMKSNNVTDFRLIPDLQEVANLLFKYKRYKNLEFDITQKHGYNYFQGQPIYMIKPMQVSKSLNEIKYTYSYTDHNNLRIEYQPIFLNHDTALGAWKNYTKSFNKNHIPVKPYLYVSNLETLIHTPRYIKNQNEFIFLPSLNTFNFIKIYSKNSIKNSNDIIKTLINKSLGLRSLCYRIIWSLTTRQPNSW